MASQRPTSTEFWRALTQLRWSGGKPSLVDIANIANQTGASLEEALDGISRQRFSGQGLTTEQPLRELVRVIGQLLKVKRVLEVGETGIVQSTRLVETVAQANITYLTRNVEFAEACQALRRSNQFRVVLRPEKLGQEDPFRLIIAQPPLGYIPPTESTVDGFGGDEVKQLMPLIADDGWFIWVTSRGVLRNNRGRHALANIAANGWSVSAAIDLPSGVLAGYSIEGIALILCPRSGETRLLGSLRDDDTAGLIAVTLVKGPSRKVPPTCVWVDSSDFRTFADIERERLIQRLMPRGRYTMTPLSSLLASRLTARADQTIPEDERGASFIYVPEYVASKVTKDIDEQTVRPKAVYRLCIDTGKVNPVFLVQLLNSEYGKFVRYSVGH